ncbi:hypothetical protein QUC32_27620 (plasmid) [Novosphingobium resinovorum]|jgi:hypothetical protein|uniref:Uncharacterized protein n=1 Tax=Novosphingobium resinovorum TaxID=158500 RepID=A0A1D8AEW3_9SPHN|nr:MULTISPECIES: hypothetical protein [Sphingomonadaceae]AOR80637.1 hypothetical protein BES08_27785 [Novosphingobium resinovorum]EJU13799.1 PAS/PAC sensor hybrid histidine kinase [Sphingomonas sp. LH128]MBF7015463.1 hypothetical protein [Novosphingobium sp. HR1a]WJM30140.1 hypothetical protein QUC32_27620 [Novosphingobium resinovorum]
MQLLCPADNLAETADRAAKLTSQLLAFAWRQALTTEVFDAAVKVGRVADMLRTVMGWTSSSI